MVHRVLDFSQFFFHVFFLILFLRDGRGPVDIILKRRLFVSK